jgi:DNA-binding beta-propeller fold protein YncE
MSVRLGQGEFVYEVDTEWAKLPEGWSLKEVAGVATDPEDNVYVFNRGAHPMIVFNHEGRVLRTWGEGLFSRAHGVTYAPDGTLWCADDGDHTVRQCTPDGRVLLTLGNPGQPAPYQSGEPFNRPTTVALDPTSDAMYITDGYGNARVHKYARSGARLFSWGRYGTDPGEFNLVHAAATDRQGRLYVADRENHRVQVFDPQGQFITQWNNLHRPCGILITDTEPQLCYIGQLGPALEVNLTYPNLGARVTIHDLSGKRLAWLGDTRRGEEPGQFMSPHDIAVDSRGDVYVAEVSWSDVGRKLTPPRELRCFRKLVRVR